MRCYLYFLFCVICCGCSTELLENELANPCDSPVTVTGESPTINTGIASNTTSPVSRDNALVLIHAPGMGIAQTNPYSASGNRPRTGQHPMRCNGAFPNNGADARFTDFWLWLDNASYQPQGPLPAGVAAPSFGHLSRRLEDAGYKRIKISFDATMLKLMLDENPAIIITASKGINEAIDAVNAKNYSGALLLINGATMDSHKITASLHSLVLTHGRKDVHGSNRIAQNKLLAMAGTKMSYFVYENIHDGHNPRSLAFPSKQIMTTANWDHCFDPSPVAWNNNSPGGNHRNDQTDSYLINLVDSVILDSSDWQKNLVPKLKLDPNVFNTWDQGLAGFRNKQ